MFNNYIVKNIFKSTIINLFFTMIKLGFEIVGVGLHLVIYIRRFVAILIFLLYINSNTLYYSFFIVY